MCIKNDLTIFILKKEKQEISVGISVDVFKKKSK